MYTDRDEIQLFLDASDHFAFPDILIRLVYFMSIFAFLHYLHHPAYPLATAVYILTIGTVRSAIDCGSQSCGTGSYVTDSTESKYVQMRGTL